MNNQHGRLAAAFLFLLVLTGCPQMALQPAETFEQKLAYAYGQHTAVLQAAERSLRSNAITTADAETVMNMSDKSRLMLDSAKLASQAGDPETAEGRLALATTVLRQLLDYLNARGGAP